MRAQTIERVKCYETDRRMARSMLKRRRFSGCPKDCTCEACFRYRQILDQATTKLAGAAAGMKGNDR